MRSSENLDAQSSYPQPGAVRWEVLARWRDSAVDGVVHGSEWCWKNDDLQVRPQNSRITRESPLRARSPRRRVLKQPFEIGYQPKGSLTAARSIACRMMYRKFSWLADHGRVTIALAIPIATLQHSR
jgi:hypothetical protein